MKKSGHTPLPVTLMVLAMAATSACSSTMGPEATRSLGRVATEDLGLTFDEGGNPSARILYDRTIEVTITTVGACAATRADWDVTVAEGSGDALVFILPYEFREECALSPDRVLRLNPFTHTEVVDLQWAREVLIRVVDATAEPVDINLEVPSR